MTSSDQASQDRIVLQDTTKASPHCPGALVFRQQMSIGTQLMLAVFGLLCQLPFYQLVMLTDEQELTRPRGDVALVLFAIGVTMLAVALSRTSRTVTFDPSAREMVVLRSGSFGPRRQRRYPFRDLGSATVVRATGALAGAGYRAEIHCLCSRRPIKIGDFAHEQAALEIARSVTTMTSRLVS